MCLSRCRKNKSNSIYIVGEEVEVLEEFKYKQKKTDEEAWLCSVFKMILFKTLWFAKFLTYVFFSLTGIYWQWCLYRYSLKSTVLPVKPNQCMFFLIDSPAPPTFIFVSIMAGCSFSSKQTTLCIQEKSKNKFIAKFISMAQFIQKATQCALQRRKDIKSDLKNKLKTIKR